MKPINKNIQRIIIDDPEQPKLPPVSKKDKLIILMFIFLLIGLLAYSLTN